MALYLKIFLVCVFLQPLPEKKSFSKHFDRFSTEFLRSRQIALNKFVSRIADHPVMSFNDNFHVFLTAKTWVSASCLVINLRKCSDMLRYSELGLNRLLTKLMLKVSIFVLFCVKYVVHVNCT